MLAALFNESNNSCRVDVYSMVGKIYITIVSRNGRNRGEGRRGGLLHVLFRKEQSLLFLGGEEKDDKS